MTAALAEAGFVPIRKGRALTADEQARWIDAVRRHPWSRRTRSITQVAEAFAQCLSELPCDFVRKGCRELARMSGSGTETVHRVLATLVKEHFLHADTPGSHRKGQAATFGVIFNRVDEARSLETIAGGTWLDCKELWTGDGYGGTARLIAERITLAGPGGTASRKIADELGLHTDTVRAYAVRFGEDGFVDVQKRRRLFWIIGHDPSDLAGLCEDALWRMSTPLRRHRRGKRIDLERKIYREGYWADKAFERKQEKCSRKIRAV